MRTEAELRARIDKYDGVHYIYHPWGYIAWQTGTGENVELLFIEVSEKGKGYGTQLVREMCERIKPYTSVYAFRRDKNHDAGHFYHKLGFKSLPVPWLYHREMAVLQVISYEELCKNLSIMLTSGKEE